MSDSGLIYIFFNFKKNIKRIKNILIVLLNLIKSINFKFSLNSLLDGRITMLK